MIKTDGLSYVHDIMVDVSLHIIHPVPKCHSLPRWQLYYDSSKDYAFWLGSGVNLLKRAIFYLTIIFLEC